MVDFAYAGLYRMQSRRKPVYAELAGDWEPPADDMLSCEQVNAALRLHPGWDGANIDLRAARVHHRAGAFRTAADALYYRQSFMPAAQSEPMDSDIVDIEKLLDHWTAREPYLRRLFDSETYDALRSHLTDVRVAATNEYFCHEAGHALGWAIATKYEQGYFRVRDRVAWPLIFVEEFRADMESLGFALTALSPDLALATFVYHLSHRFGLAAYSAQQRTAGSGAVPYLLFALLYDQGFFIAIPGQTLRMAIPPARRTRDAILAMMDLCARHASSALTAKEHASAPLDAAINAASYFRERTGDARLAELYAGWLHSDNPGTHHRRT